MQHAPAIPSYLLERSTQPYPIQKRETCIASRTTMSGSSAPTVGWTQPGSAGSGFLLSLQNAEVEATASAADAAAAAVSAGRLSRSMFASRGGRCPLRFA